MNLSVLNFDSSVSDQVCALDPGVFGVIPKPEVMNEVVKWQLAKRRSGTRKVKGVGEVEGSTRKPHQQKKTGRARLGSAYSAQCRGGGVVFGPVVRDHGYSLNKKVRSLGLRMSLSLRVDQGDVSVFRDFNSEVRKTSEMDDLLYSVSRGLILIVSNSEDLRKLCNNIPRVNVIRPCGVNVYDVLRHSKIILTFSDVRKLEARFL